MVVGVMGRDPFGAMLDAVTAEQPVRGRPVIVKRFRRPKDLEPCHLLFISLSDETALTQVLTGLRDEPVLTVGESESFVELGGIIQLFIVDEMVRFQIGQEAADLAGVRISARLLSLSQRAGRDANPGQ